MSGAGGKPQDRRARFANAVLKACRSLLAMLPLFLGVMLLMGLFQTLVSREAIRSVFTESILRNTVVGTAVGSISAGNPIASYIIAGELLESGVSLFAVTAFIVAWVTVGVVQFPAEAGFLGWRFATARNLLGFVLAVAVSIATVTILTIVQ